MSDAALIALFAMVPLVFATFVGTLIAPWVIARSQAAAAVTARKLDAELALEVRLHEYARQDEVARRLELAQRETQNQLGVIHALVNNSYTEVLKAQLVANEQVKAFQDSVGGRQTKAIIMERTATEKEIARLRLLIQERTEIAASEMAKNTAADRSATATEKVADETKRIADATETAVAGDTERRIADIAATVAQTEAAAKSIGRIADEAEQKETKP